MKAVLAGLLSLFSLHAMAAEAPGQQFTSVGANQLAWECRGEGSKTVLLIAGMGLDAHATYKNTFRHFAVPGYQVCLYDRAGVGKSTPQNMIISWERDKNSHEDLAEAVQAMNSGCRSLNIAGDGAEPRPAFHHPPPGEDALRETGLLIKRAEAKPPRL